MKILAVLVICICLPFNICVQAKDAEDEVLGGLSDASDIVAEQYGEDILQIESFEDMQSMGADLVDIITEHLLDEVFGVFTSTLPHALSLLCIVGGLIILSAVCNALCLDGERGELRVGFAFLSSSAVIAALLTTVIKGVSRVEGYFDGLNSLIGSMIPVTGVVWAMGGNVGSASAGSVTLYGMLAVTEWLCSAAVFPVCAIIGISAICSGLSDGCVLDGFAGGVKKVYNFFVGLIMSIFVFALSTQTAVTTAADTVAARGAKLISATVIPGVGGSVGETLRTVSGSVGYIKSIVGTLGIVLILLMTLQPLVYLLLSRLVLIVCSTVANSIGCKREGKMLSEMGNIYGFLIGAVAICAVAFIIAFGIFLKCAVALD